MNRPLAILFLSVLVLLACRTQTLFSSFVSEPTEIPPTRTPIARITIVPTPEPSPVVPPTPIPEPAFATAKENLRVRAQPNTTSAIMDRLNKGDRTEIVGRTAANDWWQIPLPTDPNRRGWVLASVTDTTGAINAVPIVGPGSNPQPPAPQPQPQPPRPYP
jgi:uncharacterized protein YgiM (DUF1202 family)